MEKIGIPHASTLLKIPISELLNNSTTYNNSENGSNQALLNVIYPIQINIENILNREVVSAIEGKGYGEETSFKILVKREKLKANYEQATQISALIDRGVLSINEARTMIDPTSLLVIEDDWAEQHFARAGNDIVPIDSAYYGGTTDDIPVGDNTTLKKISKK